VPRSYRYEVPDGTFHIATRAVFERHAFDDVADRWNFIGILAHVIELCGWRCKSYCLMGTHYHLIMQTPFPNLSLGMQYLNGRYAQNFNGRHGRYGHLFSGRFYSVLIETESHLFAALRYVARNPVEAGLCESAADWRWSSFAATAGLEPALRLLDVDGVLSLFSSSREAARAQFVSLVEGSSGTNVSDDVDLVRIDGV
jgi:putative transposase